jgi:hypothetical protein
MGLNLLTPTASTDRTTSRQPRPQWDRLVPKIRHLDKLVDELAKGKPMERRLRVTISGEFALRILV